MNTKHTHGPWDVKISHGSPSSIIGGRARQCAKGATRQQLAMVCLPDDDNGGAEAWIANANLIAAAPELLASCIELAARLEGVDRRFLAALGEHAECEPGEITRARAAIAKATGENNV